MESGEVSIEVDEAKLEEARALVENEFRDSVREKLGAIDLDSIPDEQIEDLKRRYLNNLPMMLSTGPGGEKSHLGYKLQAIGAWNRIGESPHDSDLRGSQTGQRFCETLEAVFDKECPDRTEFDQAYKERDIKTINTIIWSVNIRMRALGYNHFDVTA